MMATNEKTYMRNYMKDYIQNNMEWKIYYATNQIIYKACKRVKLFEEGKKTKLKQKDAEFKKIIDAKLQDGMTWLNYGEKWQLKQFDLINKIRRGATKDELCLPHLYSPVLKPLII